MKWFNEQYDSLVRGRRVRASYDQGSVQYYEESDVCTDLDARDIFLHFLEADAPNDSGSEPSIANLTRTLRLRWWSNDDDTTIQIAEISTRVNETVGDVMERFSKQYNYFVCGRKMLFFLRIRK